MVLSSLYTMIFFIMSFIHYGAYHLVYKSEGVKYPDIVDVSNYDPNEYRGTIVAYLRDDPDKISLHEQFAYK